MYSNKKVNNYYNARISVAVMTVCIIYCISTSCSHTYHPNTPAIAQAERMIWTSPDSARLILEGVAYDSLPEEEQAYWQLLHQHSAIWLGLPVSPDSVMGNVITYLTAQHNDHYLSEALYVQGVAYYLQNRYNEAMQSLKQAENYIAALDTAEPYIGMIYYMQGNVMDQGEELYHIAQECYMKALPYFQSQSDSRRLACCYRDIARTLDFAQDSMCLAYYDTALHIARDSRDVVLYMDIAIQKASYSGAYDSLRVYRLCRFSVDSMHNPHYAPVVAEYLIARDRLQEATPYMAMLAQDTVGSKWHAQQYKYLRSWWEAKTGDAATAYDVLREIYRDQSEQIAEDAKVRTYTIARHYDLEREQEKSLRLTIQRQRLWITVGCVCAVLVLIVLLAAFVIKAHRTHEQQLRHEQELTRIRLEADKARLAQQNEHQRQRAAEERKRARAQMKQLNADLAMKRDFLHRILADRIELAKRVNQSAPASKKPVPSWLRPYINRYSLATDSSWKAFLKEFNTAYSGFVPYIRAHYPSLTDSDIQYIILLTLGFNNSDIAFVLDRTDRTIWNRRNTICVRLGNAHLVLDEWVEQLRKEYIQSRATSTPTP